jgi:primosomal protein N'
MSTEPQIGATVRLVDVFAKQVEMGAQLAVIHEQLKAIPDHEQRLRALEGTRAKLLGAAIAVSAVVSGAGTWIGLALSHR